jgi:methyltransferase (TIGR00027 family)
VNNEADLRSALGRFYSDMALHSTPEAARNFSVSYRAAAVVWHRYTEDELGKALEHGVSQYVIMGAGLDSFAYRRRDLGNKLQVFEIDHPASQEWKKEKLGALGVTLPQNLSFVPVDFEKQTLMQELASHGYRKDLPAFFSWLGVTQYLTEKAVFQTLHEVASASVGSEIILEYVLPERLLEAGDRQIVAGGRSQPSEPWITTFSPDDLAERLTDEVVPETYRVVIPFI